MQNSKQFLKFFYEREKGMEINLLSLFSYNLHCCAVNLYVLLFKRKYVVFLPFARFKNHAWLDYSTERFFALKKAHNVLTSIF